MQSFEKLLLGGYEMSYEKNQDISYQEFRSRTSSENYDNKSLNEIENSFWETLSTEHRLYSIDNQLSLFSGDVEVWNLNQFTKYQSNIQFTQTVYTFARELASFSFHVQQSFSSH